MRVPGYQALWPLRALPGGELWAAQQEAPLRRGVLFLGEQRELPSLAAVESACWACLIDGGVGWSFWEHLEPCAVLEEEEDELRSAVQALHQAGLAHGALLACGPARGSDGRLRLWGLGPGLAVASIAQARAQDLLDLERLLSAAPR